MSHITGPRRLQISDLGLVLANPLVSTGTWRVGGLSKWVISRLVSTLKRILIGVMVVISLE